MKKSSVTIRDIAERAGVSKSTVSLALSDRYGVNGETRANVLYVAHELGYDMQKIKMRVKKTHKKIAIVAEYKSLISERFWCDITLGIEKGAVEYGLELEVLPFNEEMDIKQLSGEVLNKNIGGLLLVFRYDNILIDKLKKLEIPIVLVEPRNYFGNEISQITSTHYLAGRMTAKYLIDAGHKSLIYFGNVNYSFAFLQRYNGFRDYIAESGVAELKSLIKQYIKSDDRNSAGDYTELNKILHSQNPPTAMVCANDVLAIGAYEFLKKERFDIPGDISVMGFDDIKQCDYLYPKLTTVRTDRFGIGFNAVKLILDSMRDKDCCGTVIQMPVRLIERDSVKKINAEQFENIKLEG